MLKVVCSKPPLSNSQKFHSYFKSQFAVLCDIACVVPWCHTGVMDKKLPRTEDLIGAISANIYMLLIIALFIARMVEQIELASRIGLVSFLVIIPSFHSIIKASIRLDA